MATRLKTLGFQVPILGLRVKARLEGESWRAGKTTAERGYGGKWQREREAYLKLHPFCEMCAERGIEAMQATVVDHKIPHRGDMKLFWDRGNWQSLCGPDHSSVKQRQERGV